MPVYSLGPVVPKLGTGVFIAPNATVIGDVELGDDASVWFGTVLRGDHFPIKVGARTNIQDNSVLHITGGRSSTTVGSDVTIGHMAIVHGCRIGDHCLVGMGSIVLDDAIIEDECLIAAGALVPPGMRVPSRSLVMGRPGKVVRVLGDADLEHIRGAAVHYVENARHFLRELGIQAKV